MKRCKLCNKLMLFPSSENRDYCRECWNSDNEAMKAIKNQLRWKENEKLKGRDYDPNSRFATTPEWLKQKSRPAPAPRPQTAQTPGQQPTSSPNPGTAQRSTVPFGKYNAVDPLSEVFYDIQSTDYHQYYLDIRDKRGDKLEFGREALKDLPTGGFIQLLLSITDAEMESIKTLSGKQDAMRHAIMGLADRLLKALPNDRLLASSIYDFSAKQRKGIKAQAKCETDDNYALDREIARKAHDDVMRNGQVYIVYHTQFPDSIPMINTQGIANVYLTEKGAASIVEREKQFPLAMKHCSAAEFFTAVKDWMQAGVNRFSLYDDDGLKRKNVYTDLFLEPETNIRSWDRYGFRFCQLALLVNLFAPLADDANFAGMYRAYFNEMLSQLVNTPLLVPVLYADDPENVRDDELHLTKNALRIMQQSEIDRIMKLHRLLKSEERVAIVEYKDGIKALANTDELAKQLEQMEVGETRQVIPKGTILAAEKPDSASFTAFSPDTLLNTELFFASGKPAIAHVETAKMLNCMSVRLKNGSDQSLCAYTSLDALRAMFPNSRIAVMPFLDLTAYMDRDTMDSQTGAVSKPIGAIINPTNGTAPYVQRFLDKNLIDWLRQNAHMKEEKPAEEAK